MCKSRNPLANPVLIRTFPCARLEINKQKQRVLAAGLFPDPMNYQKRFKIRAALRGLGMIFVKVGGGSGLRELILGVLLRQDDSCSFHALSVNSAS